MFVNTAQGSSGYTFSDLCESRLLEDPISEYISKMNWSIEADSVTIIRDSGTITIPYENKNYGISFVVDEESFEFKLVVLNATRLLIDQHGQTLGLEKIE